jgi:hypothetical protein
MPILPLEIPLFKMLSLDLKVDQWRHYITRNSACRGS